MLQSLKNNWYIVLVIAIFLFMAGYGVWNSIRERPLAPAVEEEVAVEEVVEEAATPSGEATAAGEPERLNAVKVDDQSSGSSVTIASVLLSAPGYVAIHEDTEDAPAAVIGSSELLPKGVSEEVAVELDRVSVEGETLYAMLHFDDGDLKFVLADDAPVTDEEGAVVMAAFEIIAPPAEIEESL